MTSRELGASRRDSIAGAIGLPLAILAVVLAAIPPVAFYVAWVPGVIALVAGVWGFVRSRPGPARRLAVATACGARFSHSCRTRRQPRPASAPTGASD
jgi:hypothetical protein